MAKRIEYVQQLPSGKYRHCTTAEIADAKAKQRTRLRLIKVIAKAQADLGAIIDDCKHPVCHDTPGYIYHIRHCIICGNQDLI
jgi:hypothetical protein